MSEDTFWKRLSNEERKEATTVRTIAEKVATKALTVCTHADGHVVCGHVGICIHEGTEARVGAQTRGPAQAGTRVGAWAG